MELKPLTKMLEMGIIPVLYGDAVPDQKKGFSILSGDQIVSWLAIKLGAKRIIMGSDVNGLYTADPKTDPTAQLIDRITLEELKSLEHNIEGSKATDVTGGMFGKMHEVTLAIDHEIETIIVNANVSETVYKALRGEQVQGTIIGKE
jgi:isopentenyl phosphate kinase